MGRVSKSIAIIGEGETEWFYFDSLRISRRFPFKMAPDFPSHPDIGHILKLAQKYVALEYDYVVCLIDMDRLLRVPPEMHKYQKIKKKREYKNVTFIETSPCTEFWFLLHFLPGVPKKKYDCYEDLLPELRKYMPGYEKTKKYFSRIQLYNYLIENGNIDQAVENAEKLCELCKINPEDKYAYSQVYKVLAILNELMPV